MVSRAIGCGSQGECIACHNHLRDAIFATASSAHLAPTKEDRALLPNSEGRPADVMLKNFQGGLHAALDVSVINPLQTSLSRGLRSEGAWLRSDPEAQPEVGEVWGQVPG